MAFGPVQVLVLGFADPQPRGEILAELTALREAGIVRLVDAIAVAKDDNGDLTVLEASDLSAEESAELGAIAGALIGFGMDGEEGAVAGAELGAMAGADHVLDDDAWYIADAIPAGSAAVVALLEHQWAIGLRGAIERAGGVVLEDAWLHPADLVAVGLDAASD